MKKLLTALVVLTTAVSLNASTHYIDFATGNDANDGTSTVTPWQRAPGMKGVSGNAAAYNANAGDIFIFKGGVTWPVACFQWKITRGGSSASAPIVYKGDPSWYAGGSFTRPIFDFQQTLVGPGWTLAAGILVQSCDYVYFDNIELANYSAPLGQNGVSNWGSTAICLDTANRCVLTNSLVRDWVQPGGTRYPGQAGGGGAIMRVNSGDFNRVTGSTFYQSGAQKGGTVVWNIYQFDNNVVHDTCTGFMYGQVFFNNHIHNIVDPTDSDGSTHSNVALAPGGLIAYGNLIHDIEPRAQVIFLAPGQYGAGTDWIYNNVIYNTAQPCVVIDTDGLNDPGQTSRVYNNTLVGPSNGNGWCLTIGRPGAGGGNFGNLDYRNNHFISTSPVAFIKPAASVTTGNNITNTLPQANANGFTAANVWAPQSSATALFNAGVDLSAYFTSSYNGATRPQAAVWDIGAYEFVTGGGGIPGTLVLSSGAVSAQWDGGSVILTVQRTLGTSGAVGVSYATANGTATAGVNYTSTAGTLSWANGDSASKTITVPLTAANFVGSKTFTLTLSSVTGGATLGTPSTITVTINGTASPGPVILPGLSWSAPSSLANPFASSGSYYSQSVQTTDPASGGVATYYFTNNAGTYTLYMTSSAVGGSDDSAFLAINTLTPPSTNIYDAFSGNGSGGVPVEEAVTVRTSVSAFPSTVPLQVTLPAGTNFITVVGREAGFKIYNLRLQLNAAPPPVDPPMVLSLSITNLDGYYKATSNMVFRVVFSTNVTVTGTPTLALNSGGTATNTSGSGTAVLTFVNTIATGENSQSLDVVSTNSLALNGGSIKFGSVNANLTLPVPGTANSASFNRSVVVDTAPPVVAIVGPNVSLATAAVPRFWTVLYEDINFGASTLTNSSITLITTGTVTGQLSVGPNNPYASQSIGLSEITGEGTATFSVAAGSAADLAGNLAPAAGPASLTTVVSTPAANSTRINARILRVKPTP